MLKLKQYPEDQVDHKVENNHRLEVTNVLVLIQDKMIDFKIEDNHTHLKLVKETDSQDLIVK